MENITGIISLRESPQEIVSLVYSMSLSLVNDASCLNASVEWRDSQFAFRSIPTVGASDSQVFFPNSNLMVYIQGQVRWGDTDISFINNNENNAKNFLGHRALDLCILRNLEGFAALDGSFLIIIYDNTKDELTIVSDRLASRPIFYSYQKSRLIFSNDIRALLKDPKITRELDSNSLVEFLRFTMVLEDRTLFKHIKCLPSASVLTMSGNEMRIKQYWAPHCLESWDKPDNFYVESLADAFKKACSKLIEQPGETALMLSGGLDSRMIAAALCSAGKPIQAVSFGGFRNDEVKLAERVAQTCDIPFNFLNRAPGYYRDISKEAAQISNGIYSFQHAHMLGVHENVRSMGINTLIHGWGLDLLFSASYLPKREVHPLPGRRFNLIWPQSLGGTKEVEESLYMKLALPSDDLTDHLLSTRFSVEWKDWPREVIRASVEKVTNLARDPYNQHDLVLFKDFSKFRSYLYPLSVRWGARERCPLFDNHLIDLFLELPPRLRFCSRAYGQALALLNKDLARLPYNRTGVSILAPELIQSFSYFLLPSIYRLRMGIRHLTGRYKDYPAEFFQSYPDLGALMRNTPLLDDLDQEIRGKGFLDKDIVNPDVLSIMIDKQRQGTADYSEYLASLLTLSKWQN